MNFQIHDRLVDYPHLMRTISMPKPRTARQIGCSQTDETPPPRKVGNLKLRERGSSTRYVRFGGHQAMARNARARGGDRGLGGYLFASSRTNSPLPNIAAPASQTFAGAIDADTIEEARS
jgi:hypothetical protein